MKIGLDIDDVLFPWSQHAHNACEAAGITNGAQVTRWRFYEDYGCTADEFWEVVNAAYVDGMLQRSPYPGVTDLLSRVRGDGHSIHLVTARGFEGALAPMIRQHTVEWVAQIPHYSLTFSADKTVVLADVFLDDSARNVEALHAAGRRAFLMDQPHNQSADHLTRVYDLAGFLNIAGVTA
jgi:hypothetical protein